MAFSPVDSSPRKNNNSIALRKSIKALELLLLSAGLFSTLLMVKSALLPYSCEIVFSNLVGFWVSVKCLLSSHLYICIIINFMVVLIAASSTLHHRETGNEGGDDDDNHHHKVINFVDHDLQIIESPSVSPPPQPPTPPTDDDVTTEVTPPSSSTNIWPNSPKLNSSDNISDISSAAALVFYEALISEAHEIKKTLYPLKNSQDLSKPIKEHVKTTNPHPLPNKEKELYNETTINLSNDQEHDKEETMEATWRSITGKKQRPKEKQLKKCETWDMPTRNNIPKSKELRKSETFNDAVSITCRGGLRRDPSTSLEEFNRQVEDFIKKFNDNMKLQRQESDQRFLDMVKGGL